MKILLVSDIFGNTPELHAIAHALSDNFSVVSPYDGTQSPFAHEEQAYSSFCSYGGIHSYAGKVAHQIDIQQPDVLVGFSAGATASWLALSEIPNRIVKLGVLFYGTRIRDHLHLNPSCKTRLFFAEHEQSFDVPQLVTVLQEAGISAEICVGCQHGFMNKSSLGYDPSAERMGIELIKSALTEL